MTGKCWIFRKISALLKIFSSNQFFINLFSKSVTFKFFFPKNAWEIHNSRIFTLCGTNFWFWILWIHWKWYAYFLFFFLFSLQQIKYILTYLVKSPSLLLNTLICIRKLSATSLYPSYLVTRNFWYKNVAERDSSLSLPSNFHEAPEWGRSRIW